MEVPPLVHERAQSNAAGQAWLDALPGVVAELAERWQLTIGAPMTGGTASWVAEAIDARDRACVLKVAMPLDMHEVGTFRRSVAAHRLADGQGCAELLAVQDDPPAMLLERLGPNLHDLGLPIPRVLEVIVETLQSFWRPLPAEIELTDGRETARWLANFIEATWSELGQPCERSVIDRALDYCARRSDAFDPDGCVLVHGDAHGWNTLRADDGFKFVDPEGLRSEPAHDLAVPMREYNEPLLAGDTARLVEQRAEWLASLAGVDAGPVWEWGFIERVSTGLANLRDFTDGSGELFLEVARRCA